MSSSSSSSSPRRGTLSSLLLLIAANLLIPISILIFGAGFFPYKPLLPGFADYEDALENGAQRVPAQFDKLVFMVVDALRRYLYLYPTTFLLSSECAGISILTHWLVSLPPQKKSDFVYTADSGFKFTQS